MTMTKFLLGGVASVLMTATAANAVPFGPATAAFSSNFSPTVTLGPATNSINVTSPLNKDDLYSGTGTISNAGGTEDHFGQGSGTINFNTATNTIVAQTIAGLFTFNDNAGGQYVFDLAQTDTITYSNSGTTNQFGLYLLGTLYDTNLNYTATATSLTLTFNNTNGSSYSLSGSLSNPPVAIPGTPVPEPASLMIIGAGLLGVGVLRRRRA